MEIRKSSLSGYPELLQWLEEQQAGIKGFVVVGINKNDQIFLRGTSLSQRDHCLMSQFYSGWTQEWFFRQDERDGAQG